MRPSLRIAALLALLAATGAQAQDFTTYVPTDVLTADGAIEVDFGCATGADGAFIWFNFPTEELLVYNDELPPGEQVVVAATAAELDSLAGVDVDRCRAATTEPVGARSSVFAFANGDANVDFLVLLGDKGLELLTSPVTGEADGTTGLVISPADGRIYLARKEFFGAPEDGVYVLDESGKAAAVEPVLTDPDLSLRDLAADLAGNLYSLSDGFGEEDYQNVVVEITDPAGSPTLGVFADPSEVFVGEQQNLTDIEVGPVGGQQLMFVLNNSFNEPEGEQIARYTLDGEGDLFATEAEIAADPDVSSPGYTVPGSPNNIILDTIEQDLFLLNSDRFGGADEILRATDLLPTSAASGPETAAALAVWPNPFADRLRAALTVGQAQRVQAALFDVLGRSVAVLYDGPVAIGQPLDVGLDASGLPAGVYLLRVRGEAATVSRTVTLVR